MRCCSSASHRSHERMSLSFQPLPIKYSTLANRRLSSGRPAPRLWSLTCIKMRQTTMILSAVSVTRLACNQYLSHLLTLTLIRKLFYWLFPMEWPHHAGSEQGRSLLPLAYRCRDWAYSAIDFVQHQSASADIKCQCYLKSCASTAYGCT